MNIRLAEERDIPQLAELVNSLAHYYLEDAAAPLPLWFSSTIQASAFAQRIASPDFLHMVCDDAGTIAGYIAIKDSAHLYHLFVHGSYQGKGIASQLWHRAKSAISLPPRVTLRSSINAVPVYTKWGFRKTGEPENKDGIWYQPMELHRGY